MSQNFERTMKVGDTGEPVRSTVRQDSDGKAPDWSNAVVTFFMLSIDLATGLLTAKINGVAAGVESPSASSGTLRYDWQTGDSDTAGRFMAFYQVVDPVLGQEVYPRDGFIWITIEERS